MDSNELTCQELVELVTDYLEAALAPDLRVRFDRHLAQCRGCTTYLEQMRQTVHLVGRLTEESVPPEAKQELLRIFQNWKQGG